MKMFLPIYGTDECAKYSHSSLLGYVFAYERQNHCSACTSAAACSFIFTSALLKAVPEDTQNNLQGLDNLLMFLFSL